MPAGAQNTQRAAKRAARCQTGRSVELIDLPSQPVEAHRKPPALITREIGKGGDGPVLHLVIDPGVHRPQIFPQLGLLPQALGVSAMVRKMEEMAIIMAR